MANRLTPLTALAHAPLALVADRVVPRSAAARGPGDFTTHWLDGVLRLPEGSVTRSEVREIDHGTSLRVHLEVFHGDDSTSVFIKQTPTRIAARLFNTFARLCAHEVHFYRHVADRTDCAPTALAADWHALTGRSTLVLPNLHDAGFEFVDVADRVTVDQTALGIEALAGLHRKFWGNNGFDRSGEYQPVNSSAPFVTPLLCRYLGGNPAALADQLPPEFVRDVHILRTSAGSLNAVFNSFAQTLLHNDSHQGNMAFRHDRALLLDWQVCSVGPALKDFAYYLTTLDSDVRRTHERDLLKQYLDVLAAGDGPVIAWDEAWEGYRILAVTGFIAAAATALFGERLQNLDNASAGVQRSADALVELESFKALQHRIAASGRIA